MTAPHHSYGRRGQVISGTRMFLWRFFGGILDGIYEFAWRAKAKTLGVWSGYD